MDLNVPSLLITDDDDSFRETLRAVFDEAGYRTLVAGDGQDALTIVQSEPVHLVLLDMHMPRLTGLDTLRALRQSQLSIPCILMSAAADDEVFRQAEQLPPVSVIKKPIPRRLLMDMVHSTLEKIYHWGSGSRWDRFGLSSG